MAHLISGRSCITILNRKLSDSAHHMMPRAGSIGKGSWVRSRPSSPFARSSGETPWITSFLFMLNLCNVRPAPAHVSSLLNKIDGSTRILNWIRHRHKNLFATLVPNSFFPSSAAFLKPEFTQPLDDAKYVYLRAIFFGVSLIPPKTSEQVSIFLVQKELVRHAFHVTSQGNRFLAKNSKERPSDCLPYLAPVTSYCAVKFSFTWRSSEVQLFLVRIWQCWPCWFSAWILLVNLFEPQLERTGRHCAVSETKYTNVYSLRCYIKLLESLKNSGLNRTRTLISCWSSQYWTSWDIRPTRSW